MSAALQIAPRPTLLSLSEELQAHLDTLECTAPESPERAGCEAAIAIYMAQLPQKVDGVCAMLAWLEGQQLLAAEEIKRLQARKAAAERAQERLESYCVRVLGKMPRPAKGQPKIEGATNTLTLRDSEGVVIANEQQIPAEYKTACLELPAPAWEAVVAALPSIVQQLTRQDLKVRRDDVKKALKRGAEVAGADLEYRSNLVRK